MIRRRGQSLLPNRTNASRVGDHNFLGKMAWCIEQNCKILGLEKPLEVKVQGTVVEIAMGIDWT